MTLCFVSPTDPAITQIGWHPGSFRRSPSLISRLSAQRANIDHPGYDFMADPGAPVLAGLAGVVDAVGYERRTASSSNVAPGYYVGVRTEVPNDRPVWTRYWHLRDEPRVVVGQRVAAGDLLGFVGSTGLPSGARSHVRVTFSRFGSEVHDPAGSEARLLNFRVVGAEPPPVRVGNWESTPAFGGRLESTCVSPALQGLGESQRLSNWARYGKTRLSSSAPYDPEGGERRSSPWLVGGAILVILAAGGAIFAPRSP